MQYRTLGRTGIQVSPYGLGALMFATSMGNAPEDSARIIHKALVEAQWAAERRGLARFHTEQPAYSILSRGIEREVLPTIQRFGMGTLVWGPLGPGTAHWPRTQEPGQRPTARRPVPASQ
jgi:aryl-alcohol dehydrogenase-like predicted oxidoreductase